MKAIAAKSINNVIGAKGQIPWRNRKDMQFFKKMTSGHSVLMGRKTFESVGVLPNRKFYILTNSFSDSVDENVVFIPRSDEAFFIDEELWIAGGAEIYREYMMYCDELYLTTIKQEVKGDTYFPEYLKYLHYDSLIQEDDEHKIEKFISINNQAVIRRRVNRGISELADKVSNHFKSMNAPKTF